MNERPAVDRLREAMRNANLEELDEAAEQFGREAVAIALTIEPDPPPALRQHQSPSGLEDPEQRQRDLDAALADSIEVASRHRSRLGRRVCTRSDGEIVRVIFEALRRMQSDTSDPGFPT